MSWLERALLAIAISEIPLQIDKYVWFQPEHAQYGAVAGLNVSIATFCLIALYALWIIKSVAHPVGRNAGRLVFGGALPLYVFTVCVSALYAINPLLSLFDLGIVLQAYMLYFYITNRLEHAGDFKLVLGVLAASLFTQAVILIGLWLVSGGATEARFSIGPVQMMIFNDGRPCGTLFSPVLAGSFLAMLILPTTALAMVTISRRRRWLTNLANFTGILGLGLTQTRGAILGLVAGGLFFGVQLFRRGMLPAKAFRYLGILVLISVVPLVQLVRNRVIAGDEGSAASRIHLAQIAGQVISEHPILGVGAGNCHLAMRDVAGTAKFRGEWFYTVHSKYLLVWVETGLVGLVLFLVFVGDTLRRSWYAFKYGDHVIGLAALGMGAGLIGHTFHMAIDVFNSRPQVQFFWACAGIVAAAHRISVQARAGASSASARPSFSWAGGWHAP